MSEKDLEEAERRLDELDETVEEVKRDEEAADAGVFEPEEPDNSER